METTPKSKSLEKRSTGSGRSSPSLAPRRKRLVNLSDSMNSKVFYMVYYRYSQKNKFGPILEGIVTLSQTTISLKNADGVEILQSPNIKNLSSLLIEDIFTLDQYEIEIIQKLPSDKPLKSTPITPIKDTSHLKPFVEPEKIVIPQGALTLDQDLNIFVDPFLALKLKPHQIEGVKFIYDCISGKKVFRYHGCILADSMGLGKTLTTLSLIYTLINSNTFTPSIQKIIIICPATLIQNWEQEIYKWFENKLKANVCIGSKIKKNNQIAEFEKGDTPLLVLSYDKFGKNSDRLSKICDFLICDEGHKLKNHSTKIYKAVNSIKCLNRLLLTGTPLQNYVREFYNCVDLVNKNILGNWKYFKNTYCDTILASQEPDAPEEIQKRSERVSEELWAVTKKFMIRRTGKILEKTLPIKHEYIVFLKMQPLQEIIYLSFLTPDIEKSVSPYEKNKDLLGLITILRKITNHPDLLYDKKPATEPLGKYWVTAKNLYPLDYEEIRNRGRFSTKMMFIIEFTTICMVKNEKLIIVSNFTKTLDIIQEYYDTLNHPYTRLDGKTAPIKRMNIVNYFNNSPDWVVLLLSSKSGGCGLNLIGASRLIMFDDDWNPCNDQQAMARIWREGQEKEVHIYRLIASGTIEEKIYQRQICKEKVASHVVDAKKQKPKFSEEFIKQIFSYSSNIQTFKVGDHPSQLIGSWLDLIKTQIDMIKEIFINTHNITEEPLIIKNPAIQYLQPRLAVKPKSVKKVKRDRA
jgi:SNF2 family DNA or RNA helicase